MDALPFTETWCVTSADSVCVLDREAARQQMCSDTKCWRVQRQQTSYWLVPDIRRRREKHVDTRLKHSPHHSETWSWHPASERRSLRSKEAEKVRQTEVLKQHRGYVSGCWRYQSLCWRCLWQICPNPKMQEGRPLYLLTRVHLLWLYGKYRKSVKQHIYFSLGTSAFKVAPK